jgi:hypothetical protein
MEILMGIGRVVTITSRHVMSCHVMSMVMYSMIFCIETCMMGMEFRRGE